MNNDKSINSFKKDWKLVNFCEFDKYATKSYCAIHGIDESLNLGDITKVDETKLEPFNMICGGSPCQDFSVAGKQKGSVWTCKECGHEYNPLTVHWSERDKCPNCNSENIEKTRSSLLVEYLRVIRANKPNFGIYENVKNIIGRQFKDTTFKLFTDELAEYGYNVYWKVLNAKNYGIPQNRERIYLIFIRKDIDNGNFKFPEPFDNGIRLKDILEDEVDEKYYISDEKVQKFLKSFSSNSNTVTTRNSDIVNCIRNSYYKNGSRNIVQNIENGGGYAGNVWDKESISPTLMTMQGGGRQLHVITSLISNKGEKFEKETGVANTLLARDYKGFGNQAMNAVIEILQATKKEYMEREICDVAGLSYTESESKKRQVQENKNIYSTLTTTGIGVCRIEKCIVASRGRNPQNPSDRTPGLPTEQRLEFNTNGCANTLTSVQKDNYVFEDDMTKIRIRKLTPKECFRLMGFSDENFEVAHNVGISNSQLYKQAGNSIVVDVLYYIFVELYKAMPYLFDDLKLSSFFSGIGAFEIALNRLYEGINSGNFTNPQAD